MNDNERVELLEQVINDEGSVAETALALGVSISTIYRTFRKRKVSDYLLDKLLNYFEEVEYTSEYDSWMVY